MNFFSAIGNAFELQTLKVASFSSKRVKICWDNTEEMKSF